MNAIPPAKDLSDAIDTAGALITKIIAVAGVVIAAFLGMLHLIQW